MKEEKKILLQTLENMHEILVEVNAIAEQMNRFLNHVYRETPHFGEIDWQKIIRISEKIQKLKEMIAKEGEEDGKENH